MMKLFLLTILVASAFAAPSVKTKRSILPGDSRYDHEHDHHHEDHHENQAEIAKALDNSYGCLVSPVKTESHELEARTLLDDSNALGHEVAAAVQKVIESYAARIAGAKAAHEEHATAVKYDAAVGNVAAEEPEHTLEGTVVVEEPESSVSVIDGKSHEEPHEDTEAAEHQEHSEHEEVVAVVKTVEAVDTVVQPEPAVVEEAQLDVVSTVVAEDTAEAVAVSSPPVSETAVVATEVEVAETAKSDDEVSVQVSETKVESQAHTEEVESHSHDEATSDDHHHEYENEVPAHVDAGSVSPVQDDIVAEKDTPVASQSQVENENNAARSYDKAFEALPAQPKSGFSFGSAYKPEVQTSPVNPGFAPGFNAYDHTRYNSGFNHNYNPNYGYHGQNGYYNSNYGKFGDYNGGYNGASYPGHPHGFGAYSGYDQSLKSKTVDPNFPHGYPHQFPVDYNKNVPYVHQPYQFRTGYSGLQPAFAPFPAIQPTEASHDQSPIAKDYQTSETLVQPTAASIQ